MDNKGQETGASLNSLDLSSLTLPSFSSFSGSGHYPPSALDGEAFYTNVFAEESSNVYRSIALDDNSGGHAHHSLDAEDVRAVAHDASEPFLDSLAPATFGGAHKSLGPLSAAASASALSLKHASASSAFDHPAFGAAPDSALVPAGKTLAAAQVTVVEPPPVPGGYLEPSYHMHSAAHPQALLQTVRSLLQASPAAQCQVDCVMKLDKFKLRCTAYRNGAKIPFCVRVFTVAESLERRYALEFQRRSGDVMLFNEIYRHVKKALMAKKLVESVKASASHNQSAIMFEPSPSAAFLLESDVSTDQHKQTLKCLTQMAGSNCVDVKLEALLSLAELSSGGDPEVAALMIKQSEVVERLIDELATKQEDVHRCALTTLANLARAPGAAGAGLGEQVCQKICSAGALKRVLSLAQSDCAEVVRESSRLLARIGNALGKKVCDSDFCQVLQSIRCCPDARAREYVSELLEQLRI